ncbi:MAG: TetR/AcrR family transcriptional regulator [Bryobacteraceae bacterium]|nr:TetR/AcrR family transcriptional regulator [Bryobacteraceae bacterium]
MPTPKVDDRSLMERLVEVFRDYGYEGASLARISAATGLEKASLYHRFPGGKEEMATSALNHVGLLFRDEVLAPLQGEGSPAQRTREVGQRLRRFYTDGKKDCLLDTMSIKGAGAALQKAVEGTYEAWRSAFAGVAGEAGLPPRQAAQRAEDAIMSIHGALVLARATGDTKPFRRVIESLTGLLTTT